MKKLILLILFPLALLAEQPPQLRIMHVGGFLALNPEQVQEVYRLATPYFNQLNVGFRVRFIPADYNPCIYKHSLVTREIELDCFKSLTAPRGRKRLITYWLTPPFISVDRPGGPQTAWIAGVAFLCGNVSTGNGLGEQLVNGVKGPSRLDMSANVLAHEVAHNLCATHQDYAPNLMHSSANSFAGDYGSNLPVLRVTKTQIKRSFVRSRRR